jgi:putative heme-binding domain-containing protein
MRVFRFALLPLVLTAAVGLSFVGGLFAEPAEQLKLLPGFKAELLYTVPQETQGSWVAMTVDPQGRLYVSDQYGKLYRVTPPGIAGAKEIKVEPIKVDVGGAHGLLWAFDSLYVMVNEGDEQHGLYRVRDTNGDGELDKVELLKAIDAAGEHGAHAILLNPDGKGLTIICGNQSQLVDFDDTRVPKLWGEDHLLPRVPDGNGFMKGVLGPGGSIYRTDPDGKTWELVATGFRNEYDAAYDRAGELFTFDADMEWDMNTPWYRPTRVCHVVSGAEFGWRNGAGKWPAYYVDSVPAAVDIGPGSPTGIVFGYGAKFPAKYQDALFICDWSYGKLYAVHLKPDGASYKGDFEEFVTGTPLALTDLVINPVDGAMYFAVGGRRTQSGLYRVTYTGEQPAAVASSVDQDTAKARALRHKLESLHRPSATAVDTAWPYLSNPDRFIRWAARVAVEHQPADEWRSKALEEKNPQALITAILALARANGTDPFHRQAADPTPDPALRDAAFKALERLQWNELSEDQQLELLRVYAILLNRFGLPDEAMVRELTARFDPHFPSAAPRLNAELINLLVFLESPTVAAKGMQLLTSAPTQEEQIEYARALRVLKTGWTPELRKEYFEWTSRAAGYHGGASFGGFVRLIKEDAVAGLSDAEKAELKPILEAKPAENVVVAPPRPFVKEYTLEELLPVVEGGLKGRNFDRGRSLFAVAQCFSCHRYAGEGGSFGPDLSGVSGRFSPRDLLESMVNPSKTISDQYAAVTIVTDNGEVVTGRIVNLSNDNLMVNTDMLNPNKMVNVKRRDIELMKPSPVSMMPGGLLNTLQEDEVLDLVAYLLSRGDRKHPMFEQK